MTEWVTGKVIKVKFWTNMLFSLIIRAPIHPFTAGQFTKLRMKINGEDVQRAYSYVNAPSNPNLEFYLVIVPQGTFSKKLSTLKLGEEIQVVDKASGFFVINEIPSCETLWMLATGTALGPYLSILEDGKNLERFENIVLVYAVRYSADLSYYPKILMLKKRYKGKLRIQTIVSREQVAGSLTGRIPLLIKNGELENSVGLLISNKTSHVMICGNPQMVKDTQNMLINTRCMIKHLRRRPGHITTENYW